MQNDNSKLWFFYPARGNHTSLVICRQRGEEVSKMAEIILTRSGGKALAAACAAAYKVWGTSAEYAGIHRVGPVCYADGKHVPKDAPEFRSRGHLYEGPYEGTLFKRSLSFRFHDRGVVEVFLTGELGYAFPGDRPSIYWNVTKMVVYRWGRHHNEPSLVELVWFKPHHLSSRQPNLAALGCETPFLSGFRG
jgi:hypothetical protein